MYVSTRTHKHMNSRVKNICDFDKFKKHYTGYPPARDACLSCVLSLAIIASHSQNGKRDKMFLLVRLWIFVFCFYSSCVCVDI